MDVTFSQDLVDETRAWLEHVHAEQERRPATELFACFNRDLTVCMQQLVQPTAAVPHRAHCIPIPGSQRAWSCLIELCNRSNCQTELLWVIQCGRTDLAPLLRRFRWSIKPRSSSSRHLHGVQRAAARRLIRRSSARPSARCICTTGASRLQSALACMTLSGCNWLPADMWGAWCAECCRACC
jgi:hypothetical protein